MNIRFLETLVVLAQGHTFRQAAQILHTTPATISQRMAMLEDELGARLLERRPPRGGVQLTAVGAQVVVKARDLLAIEQALRQCVNPAVLPSGRVRLGVIETVVHTWLTPLIRTLLQQFPGIDLDITVDTARHLRAQFQRRHLDLLLQNDPLEHAVGNPHVVLTPLCRLPLAWVSTPQMMPPSGQWTLDTLAPVPLLTFARHSSPHAAVQSLFVGQAHEPRICNFPSVQSIVQLAWDGFGVAVIPPQFVRTELERGQLILGPGPALPDLVLSMAYLTAARPVVHALAQVVVTVVAAYCQDAGRPWTQSMLSRP